MLRETLVLLLFVLISCTFVYFLLKELIKFSTSRAHEVVIEVKKALDSVVVQHQGEEPSDDDDDSEGNDEPNFTPKNRFSSRN